MALTLIPAACGGDDDADLVPAATVGTAPTTTSTTARPIDVAVIPDDPAQIDEDYVQAVVDALFAVDAEATKIFVETKTLDERGIDYLEAVFVGEELDQQVNNWFQDLAQGPDELLPGSLRHSVDRILDMASDCLFVQVQRDFAETTTNNAGKSTTYLGLTPQQPEDDPAELNPTAWMIFSDSIDLTGANSEDLCGDG
jgi:hypothetical protein